MLIPEEERAMFADIEKLEHAARLAMGSLEGAESIQRTRSPVLALWSLAFGMALAAGISGAWLL